VYLASLLTAHGALPPLMQTGCYAKAGKSRTFD
jgi:hypothetical protein